MLSRIGVSVVAMAVATMIRATPAPAATTYYVDFADGDNAAAGRSPATAWQHSPGDANATGTPADIALEPGDTIVFKGGVTYHGEIRLDVSGAPGEPIILDANSEGTFGQGRAILDGGRVIEGWQPVPSAEDVNGNPLWEDIFYVDVDLDISSNFQHDEFVIHRQAPRDRQAPWQRVILIDGDDGLLPIAQSPKPSDPFYPDLPGEFHESEHRLEVREDSGISLLVDEERFTSDDPGYYDGRFIGIHGGNNHVYFAPVRRYRPDEQRLILPEFGFSRYDATRYAFYNSPRLIENPGEWTIHPLEDGGSRIHLLPGRLVDGVPDNIGFPVMQAGVTVHDGASHIVIRGFLIQRYSGGAGGVSVSRNSPRSQDITVADCEIRFVSGHAAIGPHYADDITIDNCYIHHNPGWTTAVFLNRIDGFSVRNNYLDKNSGSGIRKYESENGVIADNFILNHFGMHASAINVYEGCENVEIDSNFIQGTAPINRNAENITFRNNVIDGMNRSAVTLPIWRSGSTRGRDVRDITIENNTFVRVDRNAGWSSGIFGQSGASTSRGLVVRNNILDRVSGELEGEFEHNIYLREPAAQYMNDTNRVIENLEELFVAPGNGDFRRRPDGPAMDAGANLPPPPDPPQFN